MFSKFIILILLLHNINMVINVYICDVKSNDDLIEPNTVTKNTLPKQGNYYSIENVTNWFDCVQKCCSSQTCNLAFYKQSSVCYLVQCLSSELCEPVPNLEKDPTTPDDYVVRIKPFELTESLLNRNIVKSVKCDPKQLKPCSFDELCLLNELTQDYECGCKSNNHRRINNRCYEYIGNSKSCELYLNECTRPNEICLNSNSYSKHGTCQCKFLYERDNNNGNCVLQEKLLSSLTQHEIKELERLNNDVVYDTKVDSEETTASLKEFGNHRKTHPKVDNTLGMSPTTSTTASTTSNTVTNNTNNLVSPIIIQKLQKLISNNPNIIVNAGTNQYIYYPTTTFILNGTNSYVTDGSQIVRWEWSKGELSPSIGNFVSINGVSTSSSPVAFIENLIEGDYTFVLKVWSSKSSTEFSQSTVQVFVRSNQIERTNSQWSKIYDNRLKLDLNINPLKFSESEKANLLTKLEIILQQPPLIKTPKIIITNLEIIKSYTKSGLSLEFYVIDESANNTIVDSGLIMKLLYKLLKSNKFLHLNAITSLRNNNENMTNGFITNNIMYDDNYIYDLRQMKCLNNCSNHGYCDLITYKCVCDRYWMSNLYKYYLLNNLDETYGNNCEWNFIFTLLGCSLSVFGSILFFYLFFSCICCCCGCRKRNNRRYDLSDRDEIVEKNKRRRHKESFCKRLFCCLCRCCRKKKTEDEDATRMEEFSKKTNEIKYSLLEDKDDSFQFSARGRKAREERTYGLNSSDDEYETKVMTKKSQKLSNKNSTMDEEDEDEDVLYDQNTTSSSTTTTNNRLNSLNNRVIKKSSNNNIA